jgi:hypothetical protein
MNDDELNDVLGDVRASYAPSEHDRARVDRLLAVSLGAAATTVTAASIGAKAGGSIAPHAAPTLWSSWIGAGATKWVAVLSLAGVGGAAVALQPAKEVGTRRADPPAEHRSADRDPEPSPSTVLAPNGSETQKEEPKEDPSVDAATRPDEGRALPNSAAPSKKDPASEAGLEEIALVSRAEQAIRAGDHAAARELLNKHAQSFAHGHLAPERQGLRALLTCLSNPTDAGQKEAQAFIAAYPNSPLASRLRKQCPEQ